MFLRSKKGDFSLEGSVEGSGGRAATGTSSTAEAVPPKRRGMRCVGGASGVGWPH